MRQVCAKYLGKGKDGFCTFMDLEKSYDRVDRDAQWKVLRLYGVGGNLLKTVEFLCWQQSMCQSRERGE